MAFFLPCLAVLVLAVLSSYVTQLITDAHRHLPPGPWPLRLGEAAIQELYDYVREAMALVMTPNVSDLFPAVAGADLQGVRRRMAALVAHIYQLIDLQIEGRMRAREFGRGDGSSKDMLDAMLDMSEKDDNGGVTITLC
ncbi:cytochrome P450 76M5-like [Panicum virgatum]|uniref:Exocyst subunit Exo70 family protein n=1 Tax=Panicum virgatum TaxID=38727 RepID=A0A8T0MPB1_PANVG|nr:cytochrome P450 76M5-like [Panicum virgatum]KAG2539271.1 hypothetical protein PVAP13_9NG467628 [Panicum virgatum]